MNRISLPVIGLMLIIALLAPHQAEAQDSRLCFNVPGITNCIEGRFREYWEQNGGLPVFGYPITAAMTEQTTEGSFLTQYFERNRFELHPEKARPYDVLLGRLGDVRLEQQGRNWRGFARVKPQEGCVFFEETGHNLCDLEVDAGFKTYWEGHGLQDPALNNFQRSLALFGLPLSEHTVETNAAGDTVVTQWFERARFEYHLNNPAEFRVLLGLLGNETRTPPPATGSPLPPQEPGPTRLCDGIPGPENAIAVPDCVKAGETIVVAVFGYEPNQELSFRITGANGAAVGGSQTTRANANGIASVEINTGNFGGGALRPGDYLFVAQAGDRTARAGFRILP